MMGTGNGASEAENVPVITFMEKENTRIAKLKGFQGVMTTNTNPLTMVLRILSEFKQASILSFFQLF